MKLTAEQFRNALRRVTSNGRFIPAIDGLRCIAIMSVVCFHLNTYVLAKSTAFASEGVQEDILQRALACGDYGVQLFFVISGLILGLPFAEHYLQGRSKVSLRKYFSRRVLRIEPPYIINIVLISALLVVARSETIFSLAPHLGASLLYLHNLVFDESSRINHAAWSLEVEVQFYLLAPFLAMTFAIRRAALRRVAQLASIGLVVGLKFAFSLESRALVPTTILWYLDFFLAGLLLADVYTSRWNSRPSQSSYGDMVALAAWCAVIGVHFYPVAEPVLALVILLACGASFRGRMFHAALSSPWVATVGGMCYTIYLYHQFIISALGRWTIRLSAGSSYASNLLLQAVLLVPPVLAASAVLFVLFEKPFMVRDWPTRWKMAVHSVWRARSRFVAQENQRNEPRAEPVAATVADSNR
jgi:peptidoglycan/LPS O-acetylase OafA/YrhL